MSWPPWRIMQPVGANLIQSLPPLPNQGSNAKLSKMVAEADVVNTFDRTLGKDEYVNLGDAKITQNMKIRGPMNSKQALGRLVGKIYA